MRFLLICLFWLSSLEVDAPNGIRIIWLPPITIHVKTYDREVFDTALELGADTLMARILVAQARFESGNFSNNLTVLHNNVFSMQHPRIRPTTSLGPLADAEGRPDTYASYNSVRDAVVDLFLYFKYWNIDLMQPSIRIYVRRLKRKYFFEDSEFNYRRGVRERFKDITV